MRGLTVRQPWAWCISEGTKRVENRSRANSYRGPLAIHAGLAVDDFALTVPAVRMSFQAWRARHPGEKLEMPAGAIVAVANLVSVHEDNGCCKPWGERLINHLVLRDVVALPRPVPYRGALGFWHVPNDLAATLLRHLP